MSHVDDGINTSYCGNIIIIVPKPHRAVSQPSMIHELYRKSWPRNCAKNRLSESWSPKFTFLLISIPFPSISLFNISHSATVQFICPELNAPHSFPLISLWRAKRFHIMIFTLISATILASASLIDGATLDRSRGNFGSNLFRRQDQQSCLNSDLIQDASAFTGQEPGTDGIKPGQAESAT